jgi:hypothetical protein
MKGAIKLTLYRLGAFLLFLGAAYAMLLAPWFWRLASPIGPDAEAGCPTQTETGHTDLTVKDLALDFVARPVKVKTSGLISWSPAEESFVLRDGVYGLRLDAYGCDGMEIFKGGAETPVFVKGVIVVEDREPVLQIDGIKRDAPPWIKIFFIAGMFFSAIAVGTAIGGIFRFLGWLLIVIGIRHPKPKTPEQIAAEKDRQAGMSVLMGVFAPFLWLLNPVIGIAYHGLGIRYGLKGLRSSKRKAAIVGLIFCGIGLVAMPLVLVLNSGIMQAQTNPAQTFIEDFTASSGRSEALERKPYLNGNAGFSIRPPKNWTVDESAMDKGLVGFVSQEEKKDSKGKPAKTNILVAFGPAGGETVDDGIPKIRESIEAKKDIVLNSEQEYVMRHGATAYLVDVTSGNDADAVRSLTLFAVRDDRIFVVEASALASGWDADEGILRESLETLRLIERDAEP